MGWNFLNLNFDAHICHKCTANFSGFLCITTAKVWYVTLYPVLVSQFISFPIWLFLSGISLSLAVILVFCTLCLCSKLLLWGFQWGTKRLVFWGIGFLSYFQLTVWRTQDFILGVTALGTLFSSSGEGCLAWMTLLVVSTTTDVVASLKHIELPAWLSRRQCPLGRKWNS